MLTRADGTEEAKLCRGLSPTATGPAIATSSLTVIFAPYLYTSMHFMRSYAVLFTFLVLALTSCVPNRKVTLLQKGDIAQADLPTDSVVRTYQPDSFTYRIQPNDILYVRFESITDEKYDFLSDRTVAQGGMNVNPLMVGELVDHNGEIPFPVLGKVKVSGLTVFEIQEKLQALANQYLDSPVVKVRLINFRITVLGEVAKEGTVVLSNHQVTMLEAIAQAGGLGELADRSNIKLLRQRDGKTEVIYLDLLDEDFVNSPYYYANQNDVLIVPALKQRPFRKYFGPNLALVVSSLSLLLLAFNLTK